jgi:hypothetical protein
MSRIFAVIGLLAISLWVFAQDVPADGLVLWLKADAVAGVKSGDPLAVWPDSSGGKRDAGQPEAAKQPTWVADGLHGKPVVRFAGAGPLYTPATLALPVAHTMFVVTRDMTDTDNGPFAWFEQDRSYAPGPALGSGRNGATLRIRNYPGMTEAPLTRGTVGLYTLIAEPTGVRLYQDGLNRWITLKNDWTGAFPDGGSTGRIVIGQHGTNVGQCFSGDIAEVLIYRRAVTAAERQRIEGYLATKYAFNLTRKPAVLCVGNGGPTWALPKKLAAEYGFQFDICDFSEVTWARLTQVNAVILFDMSRLNPESKIVNAVEINAEGFQRVSDLLRRFVQAGGGLFCYGTSYTHMGDAWSTRTMNTFLEPLDARILFAEVRDPAREAKQPDGAGLTYFQASTIVPHPATAGVKHLWFPEGIVSYGPWTRPLAVGTAWMPLVRTSEGFTAKSLDPKTVQPLADNPVKDTSVVLVAARSYGVGRIVLTGSESTISFFGYGYSPFADAHWGRIGMEKGLNGVPSDGYALLASSLKWLTASSLAGGDLGGYVTPPAVAPKPREIKPMAWNPPREITGELKYYRGVFGAMPALGGGAGSVAEWAAAAAARGLDYLVLTGDFRTMTKAQWDQLVAECTAQSTEKLSLSPALITRDDQDNRFLQCGAKSWPQPDRLSTKDPKRVQDHLGYWMSDSNFPLRTPFLFSRGQYPPWLHSGYDTFAVRTWENGKLVEDRLIDFMQNQEQGDRSRLISINLLTNPAALAGVKEFTCVQSRDFISPQFSGGDISYISSGPRVLYYRLSNGTCDAGGQLDVPGHERWRLVLKVASDVPLKSITLYDSTTPWRRYAVTGTAAQITLDGLHDIRRVLTAVIDDVNGGQAVTGSLETQDARMYQTFCSDRCNIMNGAMRLRDANGFETTAPATNHLYKAGRLGINTIYPGEGLPGIDGSGTGAKLGLNAALLLQGEGDTAEMRQPLHRILRPYESGDAILFDTPILKRAARYSDNIFGHAPYIDLAEPKVDARLVQYHFYRNPALPTAVIGDFSLTVTDPNGLQLVKGWNGFTARYSDSWGPPMTYMVFDATGKPVAEGPSADEKTGTRWAGTLEPGASILFPASSEGIYVLDGKADVVIEDIPSKSWFRMYTGSFEVLKLKQGDRLGARLLAVKLPGEGKDILANWFLFGKLYGITGDKPGYQVMPEQGTVLSSRYLLSLGAKDGGFLGTFEFGWHGPGIYETLPNVLPVCVRGLNPRWTAGVIDLDGKNWRPLGVRDGMGYTTLNQPQNIQKRYYLGNLVTADSAEVDVTFLPHNAGGKVVLDVHNPTEHPVTTTVRIPRATYLAPAFATKVTVPPGATVRVDIP